MAIIIKTEHEIELMRKAGEILAKTHEELTSAVRILSEAADANHRS